MVQNNKLGIAIVGASSMADRHARAILNIEDAELIGIFSSDTGRAREFAKKYNIKAYQNIDELLAESKINIVDITNVHCQHAEIGIKAARAGKHVISEKPLDATLTKAKELVSECRKNKVYLATVFQHRNDQAVKSLKAKIAKGCLGRIFLASASLVSHRNQKYYDASGGWRGKKAMAGGGVLINQAIHTIDALLYLLGDVAEVYGQIETATHDIEVEDVGVGVIRFKNNALATISATTSAFTSLPDEIIIHGTKGSAKISGETLTLYNGDQKIVAKIFNKIYVRLASRLPYIFSLKKKLKAGYHLEILTEIIRSIKNEKNPPVSFEQGLKSLEVVEAIFKTSQSENLFQLGSANEKIFPGDYFKKYLIEAAENKPQVLLINPLNITEANAKFSHIGEHRLRQPLDLAYLSSFLKAFTATQLIDAAILKWETEKTIRYIHEVAPKILIISSGPPDRWQNPNLDISTIFTIINQAKAENIILTGTHGTVTPDWVLEKCKVDFIIRGEPEITGLELTKKILSNDRDFSNIPGLSYRQNDQTIHNPDRIFDDDLDRYPFPDYKALPLHLYRYTTNDLPTPFTIMLASRGCPGQCIFCLKKMMPGKYRARTAENIYQEIKYLHNNFSIRSIYFQDWEFLINKSMVERLCRLLVDSPDVNIVWGCSARASSLEPGLIALMKRAGCVLINFGYESGSKKILDFSHKGVSLNKVKEVIQYCQNQNINIRSFCLVNLPGEDKETLKESAKFITDQHLNVPHINIPIPYPGTELARRINCDSWEKAMDETGKVETTLEPEAARKILKKYIWQGKFGKLFFINPKFWLHAAKIIKNKLF